MTTNKRTSSTVLTDDNETKKRKKDDTASSSSSTTSKETTPTFHDANLPGKKLCEYGEACYRQKNPLHTAEYDHPRKLFLLPLHVL